MDGPAVNGAGHRIGIPELSLQQGTAGRVEAAQVRLHGSIVARLLTGRRAGGYSIDVEDATVGRMLDGARKGARREESRKH